MGSIWMSRAAINAQTGYRYAQSLAKPAYAGEWINPRSLLTWNRVDLLLKTAYLQGRHAGLSSARQIYRSDIQAQTSGTFSEVGNREKRSFDAYLESFVQINNAIANREFDWLRSPVVLASDGSLANGAHRVASALFCGEPVLAVQSEVPPQDCSLLKMKRRGVDEEVLEQATILALPFAGPVSLLFVWPSAGPLNPLIRRGLRRAIVHKRIDLTFIGKRNLLTDLYADSDWFKKKSLFVPPLEIKIHECFPGKELHVDVFLFLGKDESLARTLKQQIRRSTEIQFSVAHSTDTSEEARALCGLLFSEAGRHFLNHADRSRYGSDGIAERIHREIVEAGLSPENITVDGSAVLAVYGLRRMHDLDLLCFGQSGKPCRSCQDAIFHALPITDLVFDPSLHFSWKGLKFLSLRHLARFKEARGEPKDLRDLELINPSLLQIRRSHKSKTGSRVGWLMRYVYLRFANLLRDSPLESPARKVKDVAQSVTRRPKG